MTSMKIEELPEFSHGFKKLSHKYKHLEKDFETFILALIDRLPDKLTGTVQISNLGNKVKTPIYKATKFYSTDFSGKGNRSGFRIIYAYTENDHKLTFIEIYHKNKKANHDIDRIKKHFSE